MGQRQRRKRYSAEYKLQIVRQYEQLDRAGRSALLRREGLYSSLVSQWRRQAAAGAARELKRPAGRPPTSGQDQELAELRREVRRLEDELAQTREVVRVQGKVLPLLSEVGTSSG